MFTSNNLNPTPLRLSNHLTTEPTWFKVKVPVLSLQIVVAEPIVSQADSLRTCTIVRIHFNAKYDKLLQKLQEYWGDCWRMLKSLTSDERWPENMFIIGTILIL